MIILNGKRISEKIFRNLKKEIKRKRLQLKLAVISVGDNPVSEIFIKEKEKTCQRIGISFELFEFSSNISETELKGKIKGIVNNPENSGIVIQLPLSENFNTQEILNLIPPGKDVDVLSEESTEKFREGSLKILPPVVEGIKKLLEEYKISVKNKKIVLVGAGKLVGKPLSVWLSRENADFSVVDKKTEDISSFTKKADIIISGVGKSKLITGEMVKEGAVLIDAGTSCEGCKAVGDIDFESVSKKAGYITPVPGGVGPLTVVCLLENLMKLNK